MKKKDSTSDRREHKIEKLKKLFRSLGKKGVPYNPDEIKDKCWNETEEEYQKKQKEWIEKREKD